MKKSHQTLIFITSSILYLLILYFATDYIRVHYSAQYNYIPSQIFTFIWSFVFSFVLSIDHIKKIASKGKLKVNISYLIFAVLLLSIFIPVSPLFHFFLINQHEIIYILFGYTLIHGFYKE